MPTAEIATMTTTEIETAIATITAEIDAYIANKQQFAKMITIDSLESDREELVAELAKRNG